MYVYFEPQQIHIMMLLIFKIQIILLILSAIYYQESLAEKIYWSQSVDLGNVHEWENTRLPCPDQVTILPAEIMFVPDKFQFSKKTILPSDGILLFDDNGAFPMKYESNADCNYTTSYAQFKSQNYFQWFNPQNWKHSSGIAVPHAFQVPCRYDHAIFEPKLAFKVSITQPVDISLLTINDLSIDSAHFRSIYSGGDGYSAKIGKMAFQVNNSLKIHEDSCLDSGGCICGRNEQEINIVCSLVKCIDEDVKCSGALKPVGHCCYEICGAVLHIQKPEEFNTPFDLNEINEILETILHPKKAGENEAEKEIEIGFIHKGIQSKDKKEEFDNILHDIRRIDEKSYQIVIMHKSGATFENIQLSQKAAEKIYQTLLYKYESLGFYIWTEYSGTSPPSALKKVGNVFGFLFTLGIVGAILYLATMKSTNARSSSLFKLENMAPIQSLRSVFSIRIPEGSTIGATNEFARFENQNGGEVEMGNNENETCSDPLGSTSVSFQALKQRVDSTTTEQSFSNPLFENPSNILLEKRKKLEAASNENNFRVHALPVENIYSPEPKSMRGTGKENPLYDFLIDINKEAEKGEKEMEQSPEDTIYSEIPDIPISESKESLTESKSSEEIIQQPLENYLEKNAEAFEDAVKNQNPMEIFNVELEQTVDQDLKSDAVNEETSDAEALSYQEDKSMDDIPPMAILEKTAKTADDVMEVLEQNAKALDELVESKDLAENQLDSNEYMEIVEPTEEVNIDDEKPLVDI